MRNKYLILMLCLVAMFSCKKENLCDCVKSTGKENTIYHDVKDFNCIYIKDKMDLHLTQGPNFEVRVEAGANLQRLIKVEQEGETLNVFNTNRCNWVRGYKHKINVYITAPYFKYLKNGGVGVVESIGTIIQDEISLRAENSGDFHLDVNMDRVVCSAHGNGDTYLTGTTKRLESDYTGTNFLYAYGLEIKDYVYLHGVSIGNAQINAPENGLMDIVIDRTGNIYYKGNPATINLTRNNKGDLIKE